MELIYKFTGISYGGKAVSGLLAAANDDMLIYRLSQCGITSVQARLDPLQSAAQLAGTGVDQRQLARLYVTLSSRLGNGAAIDDAFSKASEFTLDERLKGHIALCLSCLEKGLKPGQALRQAGFDERDARVVESLTNTGDLGKPFGDLAKDIMARADMRKRVSTMLVMPKICLAFALLGIPAYLLLLAPKSAAMFAKMGSGIKMSEAVKSYYAFVTWLGGHAAMALSVYLGVIALLVMLFKSQWFASQIERIKLLDRLSERMEYASLWGSTSVLAQVGMGMEDIVSTLLPTIKRPATRESMQQLLHRLRRRENEESAFGNCGFPPFAVADYKAAVQSGQFEESLGGSAKSMRDDVDQLTGILEIRVQLITLVAMAVLVLVAVMLVVYPSLSTVLSNG